MAVGYQPNMAQLNNRAGQLATMLRDWSRAATDFHLAIDSMADNDTDRATALVALGITQDDATNFVYLVNVINTVAAVYYGTAEQTPAFDFDNAFSALWGAQ
jgi:hypothetical protein